jgi:hypothetical protein
MRAAPVARLLSHVLVIAAPGFLLAGTDNKQLELVVPFAGSFSQSGLGVTIAVGNRLGAPGPVGAFYSGIRSTIFGPAIGPAGVGIAAGFADATVAAMSPPALITADTATFVTATGLFVGTLGGSFIEAGFASCF